MGPSAQVVAHVAVLPLLRVGPYAAFDLSPAPGTMARAVYALGLRAKVTPPLLSAPWRTWVFVGAGFSDAYTPRSSAGTGADQVGMLEVPIGVGIGHRLRGPWELCAELGARVVAARDPIHPAVHSGDGPPADLVRDDFLAVSLSIGLSWMP